MPATRHSMLDDRRTGLPSAFATRLERDIQAGRRALDSEEQNHIEVLTGKRLQQKDRSPEAPEPEPEEPLALTALEPDTAALGSPSFTIHVRGTGFDESSVILWNNAPEPTTVVSNTELTTGVNMDTAAYAVTLPVAVMASDGTVSNELPFTFTEAAAPLTRSRRR